MAGTLTLTVEGAYTNGNQVESFKPGRQSVTISNVGSQGGVVEVGTSEETISAGDVSSPGYLFLRNLDSTNYVQVGPSDGTNMVVFARLKAGEVGVIPLDPNVTLRAQANTAAVKLQMLLLEASS